MTIERLSAAQARAVLPELAEVLQDAVHNGASVSFLPPLELEEAARFWEKVVQGIENGTRVLLVARKNRLVGTVMLEFATMPNGLHRAEVQKLLVHTSARRQGIAQKLLGKMEKAAREAGKTLLVLDTCRGYEAERLYRRLGWREVGVIPKFAKEPQGYCDTVIFYKPL